MEKSLFLFLKLTDLVSCALRADLIFLAVPTRVQMGLGISETEHIGDESDEMGENLKTANVAGRFWYTVIIAPFWIYTFFLLYYWGSCSAM